MANFSGALKLTDLDDFITPSLECIKPVQLGRLPSEPIDSNQGSVTSSKDSASLANKVSISLADCLACSGCITSAESVLITSQSTEELFRVIEENRTHNYLPPSWAPEG
eukprot:Sdes_comp25019_c0_seq1m22640